MADEDFKILEARTKAALEEKEVCVSLLMIPLVMA